MGHHLVDATNVLTFDYESSSDDVSYEIDTRGWDGCLFVLKTAAIGGVATLKAQEHDVTGTGQQDIANSSVAIAADDDDQAFWLDLKSPSKRFMTFVFSKGGQTSAASAFAILYSRRGELPVANNVADKLTGEAILSPQAGTA